MRRNVTSNKTNKKVLIPAIALFCAAVILTLVIMKLTAQAAGTDKDKNTDTEQIYVLNDVISEANEAFSPIIIGIYEQTAAGELAKTRKAQYGILFSDCVVMGDSIASGLSGYGYLPENTVFCEIGGSVMKNDEKVAQAAATKPETAFFSFGMNDLGMYSGNTSMFIEKYATLIESFMEASPETEIYVNSISKPSDEKISSGGHFHKWDEYNNAIEDMCDRLGAKYIDNTSILYDNPGLYAGDGVHVTSAYYPVWIERMIKAAGL